MLRSTLRSGLRLVAASHVKRVLQRMGVLGFVRPLYRRIMRLLVDDVVTVTLAGVSVDFEPPVDLRRAKRFHEPAKYDESKLIIDMISELDSDDIMLDVGAHIGYHACFAAEATPEGQVIAVEPHPLNSYEVLKNSRLNGHDTRVCAYALSNATGVQELAVSETASGGSTHSLAGDAADSISVAAYRGDEVLDIRPSVVKIDVEGAEQLVLEGMESILTSDTCRVVYCELHHSGGENVSIEDFGGSVEEVRGFLEECGFDIEVLDRRDSMYQTSSIKAVK